MKNVFFIGIIVLLLSSCATGSFYTNEERQISPDFLGLVPGFVTSEEAYQIIDNLGVTWIRKGFHWSSIERKQGEFDFSEYDNFVENLNRRNKGIVAMLAYEVPWTSAEKGRVIDKNDLPLYLNFVREVVGRYRGKIKYYEIWNEPNFMFWDGKDNEFYELTRQAVKTIRETDPDALILGGCFWRTPKRFIEKMFDYGALDDIDIISFHPYSVNPGKSVKLYDKLVTILKNKGYNGEIWITEIGYPTHGWYPTRVSEKKYPEYILKTLTDLVSHGATKIFWYELFDLYNKNAEVSRKNSENFFGLAYPNFAYKEGAFAFQLCGKYIAGSTYMPEFARNAGFPASIEARYFQGKNNNTLVVWKKGLGSRKLHLSLPGKNHLKHDISSGNYISIPNEIDITVNNTPQFFTWEAVQD